MDIFDFHPLLGSSLHDAAICLSHIVPIASSDTGEASADTSTSSQSHVYTEKRYPDAIFRTYSKLGLDVVFETVPDSTTSASNGVLDNTQGWTVERIDIYNPAPTSQEGRAGAGSAGSDGARRRQLQKGPIRSAPPLPISIRLARAPVLPPPPAAPVPLPDGQSKADTTLRPAAGSNGVTEPNSAPTAASSSLELRIDRHTTGAQLVSTFGEPSRKGGGTQGIAPWLEWSGLEIVRASGPSLNSESGDGTSKRTDAGTPEKQTREAGSSSVVTRESADRGASVKVGIMVELRPCSAPSSSTDAKERGKAHLPVGGVWDVAGGWEWECIKVFRA